jgi:hypothetical protein
VAFEMMDADDRSIQRGGERAGDSGTDEQRTSQTGSAGKRHDIDGRQVDSSLI